MRVREALPDCLSGNGAYNLYISSFATYLLQAGTYIRKKQELLRYRTQKLNDL